MAAEQFPEQFKDKTEKRPEGPEKDQEAQAREAAEKLREDGKAQPEKAVENNGMKAVELFARYGVQLKGRAGDAGGNGTKIDCFIKRNGQEMALFTFDQTGDGYKDAARRLDELVKSEREHLEKAYSVRFADEEAGKYRKPRLNELFGIEGALAKSQPSQLGAPGQAGIKFRFLTEEREVLATYAANGGEPSIDFDSRQGLGVLISEADVAKWGLPQFESSMETLVTTELAHHALHRLELDHGAKLAEVAGRLGWVRSDDDARWLLRHKDGSLYAYDNDSDGWLRASKSGSYLDAGGNAVPDGNNAAKLSAAEMRAAAAVKPATEFINSPVEELVDAIAMFRVSDKERGKLFADCPELYKEVAAIDQRDIDLAYGADGINPRFVRAPNGEIVPAGRK